MATDPLEFVRSLTTLDVARLLRRIIDDCEPNPLTDLPATRRRLLLSIGEESGFGFEDIAASVQQLQGRRGYQQSAAAFSRENLYRQTGLNHLATAFEALSLREVERWSWTLTCYVNALQRFLHSEGHRQANAQRRRLASATVNHAAATDFRVVAAQIRERDLQSANTDNSSAVRSSVLKRLIDLGSPITVNADKRTALIAERDALRNAVSAELRQGDKLASVARMPSLVQQIASYRSLLENQRRERKRKDALAVLLAFCESLPPGSASNSETNVIER